MARPHRHPFLPAIHLAGHPRVGRTRQWLPLHADVLPIFSRSRGNPRRPPRKLDGHQTHRPLQSLAPRGTRSCAGEIGGRVNDIIVKVPSTPWSAGACSRFGGEVSLLAAVRSGSPHGQVFLFEIWIGSPTRVHRHDSFAGLSDAEVFGLIDREIYTGEVSESGPGYAACDFLTNTGEMFDGTKTFIIFRPPDRIHILFRLRDGTFGSASCSVPIFRRVVDDYVSWFEEQVCMTAPPFFPINPFDLNEKVPDNRNV